MKYFIYAILVVFLLAVNMQITRLLGTTPIRLNLLILPVIFASLEKRDASFLFLAFISGLALDFYLSAPFGSFLFSFIITAGLLNWSAGTFWVYALNLKSVTMFSVLALLAVEIMILIFARILPGQGPGPALEFQSSVLRLASSVVFGLLAALPVFALWRFVARIIIKLGPRNLSLK